MAHPAIAVLEAIIAEEEANVSAMDAQRQALMDAHAPGSMRNEMEFLMAMHDFTFGARNSQMMIRFAEIQISILPPAP